MPLHPNELEVIPYDGDCPYYHSYCFDKPATVTATSGVVPICSFPSVSGSNQAAVGGASAVSGFAFGTTACIGGDIGGPWSTNSGINGSASATYMSHTVSATSIYCPGEVATELNEWARGDFSMTLTTGGFGGFAVDTQIDQPGTGWNFTDVENCTGFPFAPTPILIQFESFSATWWSPTNVEQIVKQAVVGMYDDGTTILLGFYDSPDYALEVSEDEVILTGGTQMELETSLVDWIDSELNNLAEAFDEFSADVNGDGVACPDDAALMQSLQGAAIDVASDPLYTARGDFDLNGSIDAADLSVFQGLYAGLPDCNSNQIPDECDIYTGSSEDTNCSAIPDDCECIGDLNEDGAVGSPDLAILLGNWDPCPASCPPVLNCDGVVDAADMAILLSNWGICDGRGKQSGDGTTIEEALESMGFSGVEAFNVWQASVPPTVALEAGEYLLTLLVE